MKCAGLLGRYCAKNWTGFRLFAWCRHRFNSHWKSTAACSLPPSPAFDAAVEATWRLTGERAAVVRLVDLAQRATGCPACEGRGEDLSRWPTNGDAFPACRVCAGLGKLWPQAEVEEYSVD